MRITHVMYGLSTGGSELMVSDIMAEQAQAGHDVTLVVINRHYEDTLLQKLDKRIRIVLVNRPEGSRNPFWMAKYNLALWRTRPDVVHFHQSRGAKASIRPSRSTAMVYTVHDTGILLAPHRKLDMVFAISDAVHADLTKVHGVDSVVVHNGIHTQDIACRSWTSLPTESPTPFRMVCVARLTHRKKGQDIAIEAIAELVARGVDAHIDFIGEGESRNYLERLAAEHKVSDKVRFQGNKSRQYIYSHLADYDLFVLPSRNEGFGLTVAEAMAAAVPVLVADIEGPLEIIEGNTYGSTFHSGSAENLAKQMEHIWHNYTSVAHLAATDALEHVRAAFDIKRCANEYLTHYRSALNSRRKS